MKLILHKRLLISAICLFASSLPLKKNIAAAQTITPKSVGLLVPLSGPYAAVGEDCQKGFAIGLKVPGRKVDLKVVAEDSQADSKAAVSAFRALNNKDVLAIMAIRGPVGRSVNPLSKELKLPLLGAVGHKMFAVDNPYAFQLWDTTATEGVFFANYFLKNNIKKVALLTTEDDWLVNVSDEFEKSFESGGGHIAFNQILAPTDEPPLTLLARVKQSNPDALFLNLGISQTGLVTRKVRELGLKIPIYSNYWTAKTEVRAAAGAALEAVRYLEASSNLPKLKEQLLSHFGNEKLSSITLSCAAGGSMIRSAIDSIGEVPTRESLYKALLAINSIQTPDMILPISNRQVRFPLVMKEIRGDSSIELQ